MKTCPFCLEEMKEAARVCPHCTRAYIPGVVEILYMGRYHVVGRSTAGYSVWNWITGDTYDSFKGDDAGWKKAWQLYSRVEQGNRPATRGMQAGEIIFGS